MRGNLLSLLASGYLCHGTVILDFDAVDNGRERDRLLTLVYYEILIMLKCFTSFMVLGLLILSKM